MKLLITYGACLIVFGLAWPILRQFGGFTGFPGDISHRAGGILFHIPFTTAAIATAVVTVILWFVRR